MAKVRNILLLLALIIVLAACSSPMDLDTPRWDNSSKKMLLSTWNKTAMMEQGEAKYFVFLSNYSELDTSLSPQFIWVDFNITEIQTEIADTSFNNIAIKSLSIQLDSLPVDGLTSNISYLDSINKGIKFIIKRSSDSRFDTTITAEAPECFSTICFKKSGEREIVFNYNATIYANRFWTETQNTTSIIHSVPDTVEFWGSLIFSY